MAKVPLYKALTEDQWKDLAKAGSTLTLNSQQQVVLTNAAGRRGYGRTPAQALADLETK